MAACIISQHLKLIVTHLNFHFRLHVIFIFLIILLSVINCNMCCCPSCPGHPWKRSQWVLSGNIISPHHTTTREGTWKIICDKLFSIMFNNDNSFVCFIILNLKWVSGLIIILTPFYFDKITQILTICIQTEATNYKDEPMLFSGHLFAC